MSQLQQWADAPAVGAYKEHEVAEVFKPAGFSSVLWSLADKRQIKSGESVTIPHYDHLEFPDTMALNEDEEMPYSKLTITAKTIRPNERGRAIKITNKSIYRTFWDIKQAHNEVLTEMIRREYDEITAAALKLTPIKYVATGAAAATVTTNGTPGATATNNVNMYHLQRMVSYMDDDLRIPKRGNGNYVGVFRKNVAFNLRRDPEFQRAVEIQGLAGIDKMKIGTLADIDIYGVNDDRVLSKTIGQNNSVSEGLIFGSQAVLFVYLKQLGISYDFSVNKATDMGRFGYMAIQGDYGAGLYSDLANAGSVRALHFTSN